ncbi:MAG: aspartyl protease family protein [Candidatus Dadabacteria bacterium]
MNELLAEGYTAIPMRETMLGHLELIGKINNIDTRFLLDTGAANTVVGIEFAKDNALAFIETEHKGGGVGTSSLDIFQLDAADISIGSFKVPGCIIYAVDLSHVNNSLASKGETNLPAGVIGADILIRHQAIINYPLKMLFLK